MHLLDKVLAGAAEAQQGFVVAVEAVAGEHEEHDVQEELGEGGEGVLVCVIHVLVWWGRWGQWGQTHGTPRVFLLEKKYTWWPKHKIRNTED